MNKSAVVFIHQRTTWFLPFALRQALHIEKQVPIILLGDHRPPSPIQYHRFDDIEIEEEAHEFERSYQHMSTNAPWFELLCWMRWFRLHAFMRREKLASVFHHDSDVLIQADSSEIHNIYGPDLAYAAYVATDRPGMTSGHSSYWTIEALGDFCAFITRSFKDPSLLRRYRAHYEDRQAKGLDGGVCDMTSLSYFWEENKSRIGNLAEVRQGCVFDTNINESFNAVEGEYVMNGKWKKTVLDERGRPFFTRSADGTLVRALGLHYQGKAKLLMADDYRGPFFVGKPLLKFRTWRHKGNKLPMERWLRGLRSSKKSAPP